jgi:metal-responsive CopG/Arc/MetJ family transcriptional regulator
MAVLGFDASEELIKQIDEIQKRTDSTTRAEAIRKALKTYDVLTRNVKAGKEIALVDSEGKIEKLVIPV